MADALLNIARVIPRSAVNGPGERFVLWVQGCSLRCRGCWNPDTWNHKPKTMISSLNLAATILATPGIEGITLTGGEPFEQAAQLVPLVSQVRAAGLSVMAFTGFELNELNTEAQRALLALCDIVVAGRYRQHERTLDLAWRGSSNQRVHFLTESYGPASMPENSECEVYVAADGSLTLTGFPPSAWPSKAEPLHLHVGQRSALIDLRHLDLWPRLTANSSNASGKLSTQHSILSQDRGVTVTNNPDWERAWSAAVHLYAHLSSGGQPQPMITPLRLFPGEEAFSDLPLTYSRFYEMDVTYERSSGFFFGSPLFIAVGLAANAASNAAAKNRAARMAAPQWREHCLARAVVTNYRTMCFVQGRWLTFDHNAVVEFTADPPRAACLMTFDSAEPLCLAGYGAPWLAVLIAYFLHGPERLPYLPYLAPLAPNQLPGTGAGELSG